MNKKILIAGVIFIILILGGSSMVLLSRYNTIVVSSEPRRVLFDQSTPTPTPDPLAPYTVLLLGYGGSGHDGGYLTDTMIVAHIRPRDESVHLISLPRDIWIPLPLGKDGEKSFWKINAAYAFGLDQNQYSDRPIEFTGDAGGGELAKYAVEYATGLPVRYFISLSFAGFQESIDTLGEISVIVPETFTDKLYPIEAEKENNCGKSDEDIEKITATLSGELLEHEFPCRYETLEFEKGLEQMDGERALKFVRSRKSKTFGGDYNRSIRQLTLLNAIKEKIISVNFIPKILPFMNSLTRDLQTDIGAREFASIIETIPNLDKIKINTISITSDNVLMESKSENGQYVLVPKTSENNWTSVYEYIREEIESNSN